MRRVGAACLVVQLVMGALPASAQTDDVSNEELIAVLDELIESLEEEDIGSLDYGISSGWERGVDLFGDFEHSSGQEPGYTPDHVDLTAYGAAAVDSDLEQLLWDLLDEEERIARNPFATPATDAVIDEVVLFALAVGDSVPRDTQGTCEYVVWLNNPSNPEVWVNDPAFPNDPAGGTNTAVGYRIDPIDQGGPSTFGLELGSQGFFESRPEWDIRALVTDSTVGIFVPETVVDDFDAVNFYAFCTEQGFGFEPENSGSDQSGLVNLTPGDLASVLITPATTTTTTVPPTTTIAPTTTTTAAPATTAGATTTTTEAATDTGGDGGGGFPWILVFGGGLGLAVAGWFLYNRPGGDPCGDLLEAWKAAQARCDAANKALSEAREACETAKSDIEDLEDERKELCREWPPACWEEGSDGGWIEDDQGNRVTSRDLHLRRQVLGEVWSDYKAGNLTAQEVEAKWREMDTPEFREDQRQKDAAAKEELQDLEGELQMARDAMKEACEKVGPAEQAAKEACAAADAARKAYEDCVGKAMATPDPEDAGPGTDGGPSGPGGTPAPTSPGGGEGSQPDPCQGQPPRKLQPAGRAEQISVAVDFALVTEIWEGTERNTEAGREIALGLAQAAQELDLVGDLLSAREAGLDIGGSINGYAQSSFWSTTGGVVKGGAGAVLAGADTSFDVPTSLPTATVEVVETLAKLGSFLTGKVTDWMENAQLVQGRLRYFTQTITATPFTVWECRQGTGWVCVEKVWRYDVGKLQRSQPVRTRSFYPNNDLDRWRMQREFQRVANRAAGRIQRDAKRLIDWRRQHQAGPCD